MKLSQLKLFSPQLIQIAHKYKITRIYVIGSRARGESDQQSDVDFLVEMEANASLFGVAGFSYEAEQLLGIHVDVLPASLLPKIEDKEFVINIQKDAVLL
jgi:predicted nucleotidyltransferase